VRGATRDLYGICTEYGEQHSPILRNYHNDLIIVILLLK
jgi:hypothetical protein